MASHVYEKGPYCEGDNFLHRDGELRLSHKCPICGKLHI